MAPTPRSPAYFESHLARRWTEGCKSVIGNSTWRSRQLGYTGCYTHLARFVALLAADLDGEGIPGQRPGLWPRRRRVAV